MSNDNKMSNNSKRPTGVAAWFIAAAALIGLLAVVILLYDAIGRM